MMMIDGPGVIPCQTFQKEKPANAALIGWLAGYARGLIVAGAAFSGKSLVEAYEMSHIPLAHLINSIELYCAQHLQDNLEGAVLDFAAGPRKD
jgi:hypothetical protein